MYISRLYSVSNVSEENIEVGNFGKINEDYNWEYSGFNDIVKWY